MTRAVAVVGSGPAGFFAAEALLGAGVAVDMFDRLPVPFGLVRHGVAPDHQKLKAVTAVFETIAGTPGFAFLGGVTVGRDVGVAELRACYDAVILATGALADRRLGVPGEDLPGSVSATEFIGWYNGHPDFRDREFDLSHPTAVVVGNGNVALDVARILAKTPDELRASDICAHALEALAESRVTDIVLAGRRGPAQAKFTAKELREFGALAAAEPVVDPADLVLDPAEARALEGTPAARNLEILRGFGTPADPRGKPRRVRFRFGLTPLRAEGGDRVGRVVFAPSGVQGAAPVEIAAGLLLRGVGYRGGALPGVPFDPVAARIPHVGGQVRGADSATLPGLYVAGWIKRGPSGVIGTNRACGVETAEAVLADLAGTPGAPGEREARRAGLRARLRAAGAVDLDGWRRIDAIERAAGAARGKPREKLTTIAEMRAAAAPVPAPVA